MNISSETSLSPDGDSRDDISLRSSVSCLISDLSRGQTDDLMSTILAEQVEILASEKHALQQQVRSRFIHSSTKEGNCIMN
jgi:hypothetical protein